MGENLETKVTTDTNSNNPTTAAESSKPSYDDLVKELAEARTREEREKRDKERFKTALDAETKKNGELTKQVRERMTAEEQVSAEMKQRQEERDQEIADMKAELATIRATKRYMSSLKMDESLAEDTAKAEVDGDMEKVASNFAKHIKTLEEAAHQRGLGERKPVNAGNGPADKNSLANEMAVAAARRNGGANEDILKHYRR